MHSPLLASRPSRVNAASTEHPSLLDTLLSSRNLLRNPSRALLIRTCLNQREAIETTTGALATWGKKGETGRIPNDTYIVRRPSVDSHIDWSSPTCIPMAPALFDSLLSDALQVLSERECLFALDRSLGADPSCSLAITVLTDSPLAGLFADNMFRPEGSSSLGVLSDEPFTLIVLPHQKVDTQKHREHLRSVDGRTVDMCIAMDFERRIGLVYGIGYCGAIKKTIFTTLNYYLPEKGILPLHCAASEGRGGSIALFLGLSGTGKTTLSTIPGRLLLGDDEHLWSDSGVANMEGGCYAKLIHLSPEREPQITNAVFRMRPVESNGVIIENALTFPDGTLDLDDARLTENSRASYPLRFLAGTKPSAHGGHPQTIIFLTADAEGVLPPIAELSHDEAASWFFLGYTSKLAGTEAGVMAPQPNFSRFFGGPFMPRHTNDYLQLFCRKIEQHACDVYLVNTGWTGGPYGVGKRMDIATSRSAVEAAISGVLQSVEHWRDPHFDFQVPTRCPGIQEKLLDPRSTWSDQSAYDNAAATLVAKIQEHLKNMDCIHRSLTVK